jgi:hypothetical protein
VPNKLPIFVGPAQACNLRHRRRMASVARHATPRHAGGGNRFWPTLFAIGISPRHLRPDEFTLLPTFGSGVGRRGQDGIRPGCRYPSARLRPYSPGCQHRVARAGHLAFNGKMAFAAWLSDSRPDASRMGGRRAERVAFEVAVPATPRRTGERQAVSVTSP